jgi:hypothetical protein
MIYEQVYNGLRSLANRWYDLAGALRRLAGDSSTDHDTSLALYNPAGNPPAGLADLIDLAEDSEHEYWPIGYRQKADYAVPAVPASDPPTDLLANAVIILQEHEQNRLGIKDDFELYFPEPAAGDLELEPIQNVRNELFDLQEYIARLLQEFREARSGTIGLNLNLGGMRNSVDHIASYPMLTSELSITPPQATPSGAAPMRRTVDAALRDVLGHLPRTQDTRSFMLALEQSFDVQTKEGHTEVVWNPRSFAGQTELVGGVTGAQASLYARSKVALDQALPLLDGLYPLWPDPDPELVAAVRVIVRSDLREVVTELGTEGGPRLARVDQLFASLFDEPIANPRPDQPNPVPVLGHLGYLERVFGLTANLVNTLDEELDVTNFTSLYDYADAIRQSWINFRGTWLGRDLGTRLVLLSRALAVAAETVEEINFAMDSVFVGSAERQVAAFRDEGGDEILVGELLSWVSTFAGDEAPHLVREAGKRGASAIIPTARRLRDLVERFISQIPYEPDLPAGLRHPRVTPPLRELQTYLQRIGDLSEGINQPLAQS